MTARRATPAPLIYGVFLFCILWVAGVPRIDWVVVLAPVWVGLLVALAAGVVASLAATCIAVAATWHYRWSHRRWLRPRYSRAAKEKGIV